MPSTILNTQHMSLMANNLLSLKQALQILYTKRRKGNFFNVAHSNNLFLIQCKLSLLLNIFSLNRPAGPIQYQMCHVCLLCVVVPSSAIFFKRFLPSASLPRNGGFDLGYLVTW